MEYTDEQMSVFRLLRKIEQTPDGPRVGSVFGPGPGLEVVSAMVLRHFDGDVDQVRRCGDGLRQLFGAFAEAGYFEFGDVMHVMGRERWQTDESRVMAAARAGELDPDVAAAGLGLSAIEYWTGEGIGLVRRWYEERDDLPVEITSWLAVAFVRLGEIDKVPKAPTSRVYHAPGASAPAESSSGCGSTLVAVALATAAVSLAARLGRATC